MTRAPILKRRRFFSRASWLNISVTSTRCCRRWYLHRPQKVIPYSQHSKPRMAHGQLAMSTSQKGRVKCEFKIRYGTVMCWTPCIYSGGINSKCLNNMTACQYPAFLLGGANPVVRFAAEQVLLILGEVYFANLVILPNDTIFTGLLVKTYLLQFRHSSTIFRPFTRYLC